MCCDHSGVLCSNARSHLARIWLALKLTVAAAEGGVVKMAEVVKMAASGPRSHFIAVASFSAFVKQASLSRLLAFTCFCSVKKSSFDVRSTFALVIRTVEAG